MGPDPDTAWAAFGEKLLSDAREHPLQIRALTLYQYPLRKLDLMDHSAPTDDELVRAVDYLVVDVRSMQLSAQALQDEAGLEVRAGTHLLSVHSVVTDEPRRNRF